MPNPTFIPLTPGYAGQATGITRAAWKQRITFSLLRPDGSLVGGATFLGEGENVPMKQEVDGSPVWRFNAFPAGYKLQVLVESQKPGASTWSRSSVLDPITVSELGEPATVVSIVLSDDSGGGVDYNDAILSIFQWKY